MFWKHCESYRNSYCFSIASISFFVNFIFKSILSTVYVTYSSDMSFVTLTSAPQLTTTTANNSIESGNGSGSFVSNLTGLTQATTYYVRAYATNSVGTIYGNEISFPLLLCQQLQHQISLM